MVTTTTTTVHACRHCGSERLKKNGKTDYGAQRVQCLACKRTAVLARRPARYGDQAREQIVAAASRERLSTRAVARTFGPCYRTLRRWAQKKADELPRPRRHPPARQKADVLELDELWSFVARKANRLWLWLAVCRRTQQVVAYTLGDRGEDSARWLAESIPEAYAACPTRSDYWEAYAAVFGRRRHRRCAKREGETCRVENFNGRLRQRAARFVRKTLSFSKGEAMHELFTRLWIIEHNLEIRKQHTG